MWNLSIPWWELVLRSVVVYGFLLVLLRLTGKRQVGQLAPFDLVLLLILSNAVQNSMNAGDTSLLGGLLSAATLIALSYLFGVVTFRSRRMEALIDGRPQILIHNGIVFDDAVSAAKLTRNEINAALREQGCSSVEHVRWAILENNGSISITKKDAHEGTRP